MQQPWGAALNGAAKCFGGNRNRGHYRAAYLRRRFAELGAAPGTVSGEALGRFLAGETVKGTRIIRASGAAMD
jgi:hypothetical protein